MIRVYTLYPPALYDALLHYNETHDDKIYSLHGVWIDEQPLEDTLDAYTPEITKEFTEEMKRIANVIHGQANVESWPRHSSGIYTADVSPYLLGWVIGIEWHPYMVDHMKTTYAGKEQFTSKHIKTKDAEVFELWLAERLDELAVDEAENYGWTVRSALRTG